MTYKYRATVKRVVDADTFDMIVDLGFGLTTTQRFRIKDYDAPETWRPKTHAESSHGSRATRRANQLVSGKELLITTTKEIGMYGRYEADIELPDGRNYKDVMIAEGYEKLPNYPSP